MSKQDMEYIVTTIFNAFQAMTSSEQRRELLQMLASVKPVFGSWKEIGSYVESVSLPLAGMSLR